MKWSATTRIQDEMKAIDDSETMGQAGVKLWRYTKWQVIEKARWTRGSESKKYRRTWIVMIACKSCKPNGPSYEQQTHIYPPLTPSLGRL